MSKAIAYYCFKSPFSQHDFGCSCSTLLKTFWQNFGKTSIWDFLSCQNLKGSEHWFMLLLFFSWTLQYYSVSVPYNTVNSCCYTIQDFNWQSHGVKLSLDCVFYTNYRRQNIWYWYIHPKKFFHCYLVKYKDGQVNARPYWASHSIYQSS